MFHVKHSESEDSMEFTVKDIKELFISTTKVIDNKSGLLLFEGYVDDISGNVLDREVVAIDSEMNCIIRVYVEQGV